MDYINGVKFTKLRKRVRICDVFIAPIILVSDVETDFDSDIQYILGMGSLKYREIKSYRAVYKKRNIYGDVFFIDLETGMIYADDAEINIASNGKKYIQTCGIIPMSKFITKKYKNKFYKVYDILELAFDIITVIKNINNEDEVENLDYSNFFVTAIYEEKNIIKDKALVYQCGDIVIDFETKETYLKHNISDKPVSGRYVRTCELIPIKDFLANSKIDKPKKLVKD